MRLVDLRIRTKLVAAVGALFALSMAAIAAAVAFVTRLPMLNPRCFTAAMT